MSELFDAKMPESGTLRATVPDGFVPLAAPNPGFVRQCGNFHFNAERCAVATRVASHHLNSLAIAHGGLLATLADTAFGVVIPHKLGLVVAPVTISLSLDYISPVRPGDWVEAHVDLHKTGRRISYASCLVKVGERPVLRASGTFMMEEPDRPAR